MVPSSELSSRPCQQSAMVSRYKTGSQNHHLMNDVSESMAEIIESYIISDEQLLEVYDDSERTTAVTKRRVLEFIHQSDTRSQSTELESVLLTTDYWDKLHS